jgi:hypothetical protein
MLGRGFMLRWLVSGYMHAAAFHYMVVLASWAAVVTLSLSPDNLKIGCDGVDEGGCL